MAEANETYLWVLHCGGDGQPSMVGWAKTEQDAEKQLKALREEQEQYEFWSEALSREQAEMYKDSGMLPEDA